MRLQSPSMQFPPNLLQASSSSTLRRRRYGMVSTYPPKICGLATFTSALERELRRLGNVVDVVRIDDGRPQPAMAWPVVAELSNGIARSVQLVAATLSRYDTVIIQHEYGIFGGIDGDEVLDLVDAIRAPTIAVLHTVPLNPTPHQRFVLTELVDRADHSVVMTEVARSRLETYGVDLSKVSTIPHGASSSPMERSMEPLRTDPSKLQMLTWGLLGPGKGIEHVIDAMAMLTDVRERLHYTVAGVTHPNVLANHGDVYRNGLIERTFARRVAPSVTFDATYRDLDELTAFVARSSLVVLPYDSREQVTSGVLVDAVALGRPVIATAFPHATELLSSGAGIVVAHQDPSALAAAIRSVLDDRELLPAMAAEARRIAPTLRWSAVAEKYARLADLVSLQGQSVAI